MFVGTPVLHGLFPGNTRAVAVRMDRHVTDRAVDYHVTDVATALARHCGRRRGGRPELGAGVFADLRLACIYHRHLPDVARSTSRQAGIIINLVLISACNGAKKNTTQ